MPQDANLEALGRHRQVVFLFFFGVKTNLKLWCHMMNVFRRPAAGAGEDMRCSILNDLNVCNGSAAAELLLLQETSMWRLQTFFLSFFVFTPTWRKVEMIQIQIFTIAFFQIG